MSEKGFKRVKGFEDKNWNWWIFQIKFALKNACPQAFHLMTKMERAESEETMVEIATLEATPPTAKDDALTIIQRITNLNGFEAWRRKVARYAPTNPATVAVMRVMSPQRPNRLKELGSASGTWGASVERFGKGPRRVIAARSCSCCRTTSRKKCSRVRALSARTRRCVTR